MKRLVDIFVSVFGLIIFSPLLLICMFLIWLKDYHSPFYISDRTAQGGGVFRMVKLRSMIKNENKTKVDSTANDDVRITRAGKFIRKYKLDELSQLYNVLKGDMSLVGPRPNVKNETDKYTKEEKKLLSVKPGITDLASIVFSDEGNILEGSDNPDLLYNQVIRPWKSRLGILYVKNRSLLLDMEIIYLTVVAIFSKSLALKYVEKILKKFNADNQLIEVCRRRNLRPISFPPPGASDIVTL